MTTLVPMQAESFAAFTERTIANYANECVASFMWDATTATEQARAQFRKILPEGLATPGHHLCDIHTGEGGARIGELWFEVPQAPGFRSAYLWDLYIDVAARREHHAKAALELLETRCRALGANVLGLQVFAHNAVAQALYNSLGYSVTGFNMSKPLNPP